MRRETLSSPSGGSPPEGGEGGFLARLWALVISARDVARVLAEFRPGLSVYLQGATGEPLVLREILAGAPEALGGVSLTSCMLPGMNEFDYAGLHAEARLTTFLLPTGLRRSFEAGRVRVRPLPYSQIAAAFAVDPPFDLAIFQVTPPDGAGLCSFGPLSDFPGLIWPRARRRLAFVDHQLPRARRGPTIPFAAIDVAVEADGPIILGDDGEPGAAELGVIAARIAALIPDGAAIQTGIGGAPAATVGRLTDRRGLVVRSGMVTQGYRVLDEAGALDPAADHVTGLALGSADFTRWAAERFIFADATVTHGATVLAATPRLFALNSALEVDLFGQANLEWRGGRLASGLGGAPDFAAAARRSEGGRAVLALPSTAKGGALSRIVARLAAPTVSIPRDDTDLVITEHGVADLRGTGLDDRAEALIAVAAPDHRAALTAAWVAMRRAM
ncbi:MAG: Acyl-CoA hydrolase [Caulobacteraceae bacterium]|nr:Acyl-CoA hydrolase [Caulobacteraceae bacterium]